MSQENAEKLIQRLKGNDQLKDKFRQAGDGGFEQVAAAEGLPCTSEEFSTALKAAVAKLDLASNASSIASSGVITHTVTSVF